MKKLFLMVAIILVVLSVLLMGCADKEIKNTEKPTSSSTPTETENTTIQIHRTIPPLTITITKPTRKPGTTPIPTEMMEEKLFEKLTATEEVINSVEYPDTVEGEILYKFLSRQDGYYCTVSPGTSLGVEKPEDTQDRIGRFATLGYNISGLYDQLLEINRNPTLLPIKSSFNEGFFIDYDYLFEQFTAQIGPDLFTPGEDKWKVERIISPHYSGSITISLPVYDPATGYVLLYSGYTGGGLYGSGGLYLMEYKDGNLTKLAYIETYVI